MVQPLACPRFVASPPGFDAMTSHVPEHILLATAHGDAATVRSWLEAGGDANQELPFGYRYIIDPRDE